MKKQLSEVDGRYSISLKHEVSVLSQLLGACFNKLRDSINLRNEAFPFEPSGVLKNISSLKGAKRKALWTSNCFIVSFMSIARARRVKIVGKAPVGEDQFGTIRRSIVIVIHDRIGIATLDLVHAAAPTYP